MNYCNEFNSLSVLSLYEGELLGVVHKIYFDAKLKKIVEIELVAENGIKLILPTKNIYRIGKHAITVKNNQSVNLRVEDSTLIACPVDSKVYSINGEYLGIIKDISFNEKYQTEKILLDNSKTLEVSNLASCGKNTIIFYEENSKPNLKKLAPNKTPKEFKTDNIQTAEILPIETKQAGYQKKSLSINFLVGRVCTKDIVNFNNEILVKANTKITKKILKEISRFGKIRELMLFSK